MRRAELGKDMERRNTQYRLKVEKQQHVIVFREDYFRMGLVEPVT